MSGEGCRRHESATALGLGRITAPTMLFVVYAGYALLRP